MVRVSVNRFAHASFSLVVVTMGLLVLGAAGRSLGLASDNQTQGLPFFTVVNEKQLTFTGFNGVPAWSPDGSQIAYVHWEHLSFVGTGDDRIMNSNIWVMHSDGTERRALTTDWLDNRYPTWSPDGQRLAFASHRSGNYEIWTMAKDGSDLSQLTSHKKTSSQPAWNPDGDKIAFASSRSGGTAIWMMNPNGTKLKRVLPEGSGGPVSWSPDGTKLVFASSEIASLTPWARFLSRWSRNDPLRYCSQNPEIGVSKHLWLLDLQKQELQQLTQGQTVDVTPAWSPDGQFLVFARRTADGRLNWARDLWIMHVKNRAVQRLTTDSADKVFPSWSPDGTRIAYISQPNKDLTDVHISVLTLRKAEDLYLEIQQ